jgi:hypothetical protein
MTIPRWLLLPLFLVAACGGDDDGAACTLEFRTATVFVEDEAGDSVTDAAVQTFLVRTGELVPVTSIVDLMPGSYLILDDGATSLMPSGTEQFRVTVTRAGVATIEVLYVFGTEGGCHIVKVSGPDTVVVP